MAVTSQAGVRDERAPNEHGASPRKLAEQRERPVDAAIEVAGVGRQFDKAWVLRRLNFVVERGSIFGLLGPSGSGKTTAIRLLLGLLSPNEGEMRVLGTSPGRFRSRTRARIGYMPQLFVLYPELSVEQNLGLVASLYGMGWLKRRKPMREVLEFVELWEHRHKLASELSGGMKRRLELATALVHSPELVVVDEPTAGVDPILRAKFWDHFRELRDQGRTIVVTSQYVSEAEYCDQVAVLGQGQVVALGTPEELRLQAFGGEIVEVIVDGLDRAVVDAFRASEGVEEVRQLSYEQVQLTVQDAGVAIPRVHAILREHGMEPQQVQEIRPNFDEVFVRLMEQSDVQPTE